MRRLMVAGLAVALVGCQARPPEVEDAWVRLSAVPGRPGAAYFTVEGGDLDVTLTAVASTAAKRIELHESMARGMRPIADVAIASGQDVAFAPAGRHAMLFDVNPTVKPGDTVPLRFTFERIGSETITVDAKVVGPADPAP